jgi:hypothetical protein
MRRWIPVLIGFVLGGLSGPAIVFCGALSWYGILAYPAVWAAELLNRLFPMGEAGAMLFLLPCSYWYCGFVGALLGFLSSFLFPLARFLLALASKQREHDAA